MPAHDHVRDLAGGAADNDDALLAGVSRRVEELPVDQVDQLHALSPQARKFRLRIWLNPSNKHGRPQFTLDPTAVCPLASFILVAPVWLRNSFWWLRQVKRLLVYRFHVHHSTSSRSSNS